MLTLDALDKLIYEGMTEDSGEHFSDIAHHVRNAARAVFAALQPQQDALLGVAAQMREDGWTLDSFGDIDFVVFSLDTNTARMVLKVTA